MKKYMQSGGSILVMMNEGGEIKHNTNINFFLEEYGVMVNSGRNCLLGLECLLNLHFMSYLRITIICVKVTLIIWVSNY